MKKEIMFTKLRIQSQVNGNTNEYRILLEITQKKQMDIMCLPSKLIKDAYQLVIEHEKNGYIPIKHPLTSKPN